MLQSEVPGVRIEADLFDAYLVAACLDVFTYPGRRADEHVVQVDVGVRGVRHDDDGSHTAGEHDLPSHDAARRHVHVVAERAMTDRGNGQQVTARRHRRGYRSGDDHLAVDLHPSPAPVLRLHIDA
jgi:hypothetical protein